MSEEVNPSGPIKKKQRNKGKSLVQNDSKKVIAKGLSSKPMCSKQPQKDGAPCHNNSQDASQQTLKQKKQKSFEVRKEQSKLVKKGQQKRDSKNSEEVIEITKENSKIDNDARGENGANDQKSSKRSKERETFLEHIPVKQIDKLLKNQNADNIEYMEGYLRINPKFFKHAYLSFSDDQRDLLIIGLRDRNRAFEGDYVVARINPPDKWHTVPGGQKQKTGVIVCIREEIHPRRTIGHLKHDGVSTIFYPRDKRIPLLKIIPASLPKGFVAQPSIYEDTLFLAAVTNWVKPYFVVGRVVEIVGTAGDIKAESLAILSEHNIDVTPYSQELINGLPSGDYVLTEEDITGREDWRHECVFTIDPDTAVDLDDAVSCKLLENGNYEIGVHISDVTHFMEFLSPLDVQVAKRATTVYMTDNAYHMLPKQLCQACSLLPGQDKLTFSVIWEMTTDGKVVASRFSKTIINSCCQMAYKHAQAFIENPSNKWPDDFLNISENYSANDLSVKVNILYNLSVQLRSERLGNGALTIHQPKLHVAIDRSTGLPISYSIEELKDSNRLIEEFMLLANKTVATYLYDKIPETALLRNHRDPSKFVLKGTKDALQKFGIHLEIESSASLHASIKRYEEELESECNEVDDTVKYRMMVIYNLCSKAMNRATYKCSSTVNAEEELRHYALNMPFYTHFTSPIRRYPDCMVHRLLYSTIRDEVLPEEWTQKLCTAIARNCNIKKYTAKLAQEQSSILYFTYLIDINGPIITMGIVLDVKEQSVDVILCKGGIKLKIYLVDLKKLATIKYSTEYSVPTISISWKQPAVTQVINMFSLLYLRVEKHPASYQPTGILLPPNQETELEQ